MKYFLYNHQGCLNHGCEAIIRGTMNIICNSDKDCSFVLSSFNPQSDKGLENVTVKSMKKRSLTKTEYLRAAIEYRLKHSDEFSISKMYSEVVSQAEECDICLSVGGDTYCYGDNRELQVLTKELKKAGKKVVLWGASVGEEDLTDEKIESMKDFDAIFTRESLTYETLKARNVNEKIFLNSDPAFCMERDDVPEIDGFSKSNTIGFNVSPLIAKKNPDITDASLQFLRFIVESTDYNILLVPHVVEDGNNDFDYMMQFYNELKDSGKIKILPDNLNAKEYKGYIAKTRFFIGARTHATIAAYSSGVPTAVLGYSIKSRGISKDLFGEEKYVLDSSAIHNSDIIIEQFNKLLGDENEIRAQLKRIIPKKLISAMELGEEIIKI